MTSRARLLGGGDASSTAISPAISDRFVAPFDAPLIAAAHEAGRRVVYHTCGGMMPILERIAGMERDAMETFTPRGMGGDALLRAYADETRECVYREQGPQGGETQGRPGPSPGA